MKGTKKEYEIVGWGRRWGGGFLECEPVLNE